MCIGKENYDKFPTLLKEKLSNKDVVFPKGTKFEYAKIMAYRVVEREPDDNSPLSALDMKSFAEIDIEKTKNGKKIRGKQHDRSKPQYYGVSLFTSIDLVKEKMKLPRPNKKIAVGYVYMEGGPELENSFELTEGLHVCWWLYKDISFDDFTICEVKYE